MMNGDAEGVLDHQVRFAKSLLNDAFTPSQTIGNGWHIFNQVLLSHPIIGGRVIVDQGRAGLHGL